MQNFLSIGNITQNINFNRGELILVLGENLDLGGNDSGARNGCGKTAICNALSYALYGWAISNIKKEHLINKSNTKHMLVTLDFESDGVQYRIVRGRKPNILEFYRGGVKHEDQTMTEDSAQGDSRETQQEIERVIGMSQDMFCQIVAINTYTIPFLMQPIKDQRTIIEQLLGVTLLSEKADRLKEEIKNARNLLTREEALIASMEAANKKIHAQIEGLKHKRHSWAIKKAADVRNLNIKITSLEQIDIDKELLLHAAWREYNTAETEIDSVRQQIIQLGRAYTKETQLYEDITANLLNLKTQKCHACKQELHSDMHLELVNEMNSKLDASSKELSILDDAMAMLEKKLMLIPELAKPEAKSYGTSDEAHAHRNQLMLLIQQRDQKRDEADPYQEQIDGMLNTALEEIDLTTLNALSKFVDHQEFLLKLLTNKDSFIRKKIIEQNLAYLNTRLGHYLTVLGLPHEVVFQNDLSVDISELGRELSPGNLSRGEMTRLSLGLSFSFRDVWENLYQKITILIIDESMDNGLDSSGTENAVKLLRDMNRERDRDIWLISHKDEILSKVDTVCKVVKENGFTTFEIEES